MDLNGKLEEERATRAEMEVIVIELRTKLHQCDVVQDELVEQSTKYQVRTTVARRQGASKPERSSFFCGRCCSRRVLIRPYTDGNRPASQRPRTGGREERGAGRGSRRVTQ